MRLASSATVDFMTADHLGALPRAGTILPAGYGFGLGVAVRLATGGATRPGSAGALQLERHGRHVFFVDPAQKTCSPSCSRRRRGQLEMLCELFPLWSTPRCKPGRACPYCGAGELAKALPHTCGTGARPGAASS